MECLGLATNQLFSCLEACKPFLMVRRYETGPPRVASTCYCLISRSIDCYCGSAACNVSVGTSLIIISALELGGPSSYVYTWDLQFMIYRSHVLRLLGSTQLFCIWYQHIKHEFRFSSAFVPPESKCISQNQYPIPKHCSKPMPA